MLAMLPHLGKGYQYGGKNKAATAERRGGGEKEAMSGVQRRKLKIKGRGKRGRNKWQGARAGGVLSSWIKNNNNGDTNGTCHDR